MSHINVINVCSESIDAKCISFSKSFKRYSHGVYKQQAVNVVIHADSVLLFDGTEHASRDTAKFGMYLKQITDKYSIMVFTCGATEINLAFPIEHSRIAVPRGTDPLVILKQFLMKFGLEINIDGESSLLRLDKKITLQTNVLSNEGFIEYCNRLLQKYYDEFELVCLLDRDSVVAASVHIQLLFAFSKSRYYPSLRSLGKIS